MKRPQKTRRHVPFNARPSIFEVLEHRRMLTVYSDLSNKLTMGSLTGVQTSLESALNNVSKIPLLTQAAGKQLGDFTDIDIITDTLTSKLKMALAKPTVVDDASARSTIATDLG